MKIACIYHKIDLDGWMSAAIVKHWFIKNYSEPETSSFDTSVRGVNNMIEFLGYNYGQPIPDLSEYDKVIICDISFPVDTMDALRNKMKYNFIWIDHHSSAISDNNAASEGLRDTKFAACELTWQYFFPNKPMPEIVRLLGRYDCFGHKGTDEEQKVLEFQYGARQCISNYEEAYNYLLDSLNGIIQYDYVGQYTIEDRIHEKGISIYQYLCTEAKQGYKDGFEVWFDDAVQTSAGNSYKFICINKERFNPINFGIEYHKDGYDGVACFYFDGTNYNFSLYNDNGNVDCSIIAKQYGGGGHKGAAGFQLTLEQFNRLIKG